MIKRSTFRKMMPYMDGYGKESYDIFTKRVANDILSFSSHRAQLVVFKPSKESRYDILYIYTHFPCSFFRGRAASFDECGEHERFDQIGV